MCKSNYSSLWRSNYTGTLIGDVATDKAHVTVYTDTIEGKPETETQVEESEDTLPDGTLVKRRVTKTTEKQKLIKRIIVEGPEAELPKSGTEAEELLRQLGANPEVAAEFKPESGAEDGVPRVSTETEEFEETLADGSTVKKKIVRTTEEQFHTEHTVTDETLPDLTDAASASNRGNRRERRMLAHPGWFALFVADTGLLIVAVCGILILIFFF